jgi:hypothetical protein
LYFPGWPTTVSLAVGFACDLRGEEDFLGDLDPFPSDLVGLANRP